MMIERPIIFNTEMVKAILEGRKTQTRRVVSFKNCKPFDESRHWPYIRQLSDGTWMWSDAPDFNYPSEYMKDGVKCPYGQVGDRLWVREAWRIESFPEGEPILFGYKDGQTMEENEYNDTVSYENWYERVATQSTEEADRAFSKGLIRRDKDGDYYIWDKGKTPCRWRPSIHMPRWASRITLEITEVRVERLQEISEEDAIAEGGDSGEWVGKGRLPAQWEFKELWDSLNAKRVNIAPKTHKPIIILGGEYSWESNPWVWVVSFIEATGT